MEVHEITDVCEAARAYARLGLPVIPLRGKVPAVAGWQAFVADEVNFLLHFARRRCNVGLRTGESGYVVVDTDTEEAEGWARKRLPETPMLVRTGSSSHHRYYRAPPRKEVRNKQGWRGIRGLDVRGAGGFIVVPPSVHPATGRLYEWAGEFRLPPDLPTFSPAWVYQRRARVQVQEVAGGDPDFREYRAARWLEKVEGAVSGRGGHNRTFYVACKLTHYFGLDRDRAVRLMLVVFNPRCEPPWRLRDIEKKVDDALKKLG